MYMYLVGLHQSPGQVNDDDSDSNDDSNTHRPVQRRVPAVPTFQPSDQEDASLVVRGIGKQKVFISSCVFSEKKCFSCIVSFHFSVKMANCWEKPNKMSVSFKDQVILYTMPQKHVHYLWSE